MVWCFFIWSNLGKRDDKENRNPRGWFESNNIDVQALTSGLLRSPEFQNALRRAINSQTIANSNPKQVIKQWWSMKQVLKTLWKKGQKQPPRQSPKYLFFYSRSNLFIIFQDGLDNVLRTDTNFPGGFIKKTCFFKEGLSVGRTDLIFFLNRY